MSYLDDLLKKGIIDQETFDKVQKDLGDKNIIINDGNYIPRDVYNKDKKKLEDQVEQLSKEKANADSQLDELKKTQDEESKKKMTTEERMKKLEDMLEQEKADKIKIQNESILKNKKAKVDAKLLESGVKDPKFRRALAREIEDWNNVELDEQDNLKDFDEKIKQFQTDFAPFFGEKQRAGSHAQTGETPNQDKYETMDDDDFVKAREDEGF